MNTSPTTNGICSSSSNNSISSTASSKFFRSFFFTCSSSFRSSKLALSFANLLIFDWSSCVTWTSVSWWVRMQAGNTAELGYGCTQLAVTLSHWVARRVGVRFDGGKNYSRVGNLFHLMQLWQPFRRNGIYTRRTLVWVDLNELKAQELINNTAAPRVFSASHKQQRERVTEWQELPSDSYFASFQIWHWCWWSGFGWAAAYGDRYALLRKVTIWNFCLLIAVARGGIDCRSAA